jgi:hypothetical protein
LVVVAIKGQKCSVQKFTNKKEADECLFNVNAFLELNEFEEWCTDLKVMRGN